MKKLLIPSILISTLTFFIISGFNSCKHQPKDVSLIRTVCFETEVLPIFQSNCTMPGCHDDSKEGDEDGDINLKTYTGILKGVVPGKPDESKIYEAITNKWGEIMPPPPNNPLTKTQRSLIYLWILQGAKTCDTTALR